jgi:hypothetical protein
MKILVDSDEYRCWHEVGHAIICLHLGGDVDFIELLYGDSRAHARARCVVTDDIERIVACGGFAAECYLLKFGYAEKSHDDQRDINRIIFHNATGDGEDFWGRKLGSEDAFSKEEDTEFMRHAIGLDGHGGMIPLFHQHFPAMQALVRELCSTRRVEGSRVKELLRVGV